MDTARLPLAIIGPEPPDLFARVRDALAAEGKPAITADIDEGVLRFRSDSAEFMLRARVYAALDDLCGYGQTWRRFRAMVS